MDTHSLLAFTLVAAIAIAIASPGPATLMAINNSINHGQRSTLWSCRRHFFALHVAYFNGT